MSDCGILHSKFITSGASFIPCYELPKCKSKLCMEAKCKRCINNATGIKKAIPKDIYNILYYINRGLP